MRCCPYNLGHFEIITCINMPRGEARIINKINKPSSVIRGLQTSDSDQAKNPVPLSPDSPSALSP